VSSAFPNCEIFVSEPSIRIWDPKAPLPFKHMDKQAEYVLSQVAKRGVRFIRLWFTDVQGFLKSVAINPAELEAAFAEGMTFDGSSIDGYARVQEADMVAHPDPSTFQILPWRPGQEAARMFCDIRHPNGDSFEGDPRQVLRSVMERAKASGYRFYVGPEIEYYFFEDDSAAPRPLDRGGYFDLTAQDATQGHRRSLIERLETLGIPVESSHHEDGPSQHEIILRYDDALTMADNVMTFRLATKEIALSEGKYATFMPKPLDESPGSGMHLHLSLFEGEENAFYSEDGLSETGRQFVAGLLHHAPAITAITNQWVNSYKRLVDVGEAPIYSFWAHNNQSALVRVPTIKSGKKASARLEIRSPDAACNPYLAFAILLAAGLDGIEQGMQPPPEIKENVFEMTPADRASLQRLPRTLAEALDQLAASDLAANALGGHVIDWFIRNKRREWDEYQRHVSQFELENYLPIL
jgi:glutamine synthetase